MMSLIGLATQLLIAVIMAMSCLALFELLRSTRHHIYAPKPKYITNYPVRLPNKSVFSWVVPVISTKYETVEQAVGADAVIFLKYLEYSSYYFFACFAIGLVLVVPANCLGGGDIAQTNLDYLSIGNVPEGSQLLWIHTIATWIISLLTLWFMKKLHNVYLIYRRRHLVRELETCRTVMIRNLKAENVAEYLESLNIGALEEINVHHFSKELAPLISQYQKHVQQFEQALLSIKPQIGNEAWDNLEIDVSSIRLLDPQIIPRQRIGKKTVNALDYHYTKVLLLRSNIERLRKTIDNPSLTTFVTFHEAKAALICSQINITDNTTTTFRPAPEARDIIWSNLLASDIQKTVSKYVIFSITVALIIFWLIPVSAISSLTSLEELSNLIPGMEEFVNKSPLVKSFIQNVLPTILTSILMGILPSILYLMSAKEYPFTRSELNQLAASKYFFFLVFNVFLVFTIVGTFSKSLEAILKNPAEIINILASRLPDNSSFFINYVVLTIGNVFLEFLQIWKLLMEPLRPFFANTPRSTANFYRPTPFYYYFWVPLCSLIFVISISYSVISPLISLFAFVYFLVCFITYKYELVYIAVPDYETGGKYWEIIYNHILCGLIIFQITMFGLLLLKKALVCGISVFLFIVMTLVYNHHFKTRFFSNGKYLPIEIMESLHKEKFQKYNSLSRRSKVENYDKGVKSFHYNQEPLKKYVDPLLSEPLPEFWLSYEQPKYSLNQENKV